MPDPTLSRCRSPFSYSTQLRDGLEKNKQDRPIGGPSAALGRESTESMMQHSVQCDHVIQSTMIDRVLLLAVSSTSTHSISTSSSESPTSSQTSPFASSSAGDG